MKSELINKYDVMGKIEVLADNYIEDYDKLIRKGTFDVELCTIYKSIRTGLLKAVEIIENHEEATEDNTFKGYWDPEGLIEAQGKVNQRRAKMIEKMEAEK